MDAIYTYSVEKNQWLLEERGIGFEEIISAIQEGLLLDVLSHPNPRKYPNQQVYIVCIMQYVYCVPCLIQVDGNIFLKTIFPSRKLTKRYLGGGQYER